MSDDSEAFRFFPGSIARFRRSELFLKAAIPSKGSAELAKLRYRNFTSSLEAFRKIELAFRNELYLERDQFLPRWLEAVQRKAAPAHQTFVHLLICPTERRLNEAPIVLESLKKCVSYSSVALVRIRPDLHRNMSDIQQEIVSVLGRDLLKRNFANARPEYLSLDLIVNTLENSGKSKEILLVVMVEEAHIFPEALLQEFYSLCSALCNRLRIAVIGLFANELIPKSLRALSSPVDRMDVTVCPSAADRDSADSLSLKLASSTDLFFKLNADITSYMLNECSRSQPLSVADFTRLYVYCMLEHFRRNEASVRCVTVSTFDEALRGVKGKGINDAKSSKLGKRKTDDDSPGRLRDACNEYTILHRNFFFGLQALSILNKWSSARRFGSSMKDMFCLVQSPSFVGSREWKELFLSLVDMEMDKFESCFEECQQLIENNKPLSDELELAMNEWKQSKMGSIKPCEKTVSINFQQKRVSLRKLQEEIQLAHQSASKVQVSQEKKALSSLSAAFTSLLQHPSTLSLYTASYCGDRASLHSILEPSLWRTLENRISEHSLSDASIIFSLYRNNACDSLRVSRWFSEFKDQLKHSKQKPIEIPLARFFRVLADFEYVGIISPYRRSGVLYCKKMLWY